MDVTNTVDVTDPHAVLDALRELLLSRYMGFDFASVEVLVRDFARLYRGEYPGFRECDLPYHDLQHVLDVTLAMARLMEGHAMSHPEAERFGPDEALAGIASALFHDSGYIRRVRDTRHDNGAAYTRIHVSRSARFLTEYLPSIGLGHLSGICKRLVHYTGYELNPLEIESSTSLERELGTLLGTADLIAQMADVDYLRKCHDSLYPEFEAGGMAGLEGKSGSSGVIYESAMHLLESTPNFIRDVLSQRLDGYFGGAYRYAGVYFGGSNLYMETIAYNSARLEELLAREEGSRVSVGLN